MQVTNKKQRRGAFAKFFILFLITAGLITLATFFNFKVPEKENKDLREQVEGQAEQVVYMQSFAKGVDSIKNILDSINLPGQNVFYLDQAIGAKVVAMQNKIPTDNKDLQSMYNNVTQILLDLQATKKKVREISAADQEVGQYKQQIESLKDELERTRNELQICRQLQNMGVN